MKALFILLLAIVVFGSGAYFTYELYIRPQQELKAEKEGPPPPPPPDLSLPEFAKCQEVLKSGDIAKAKAAFESFIDHNPQSKKLDEARKILGTLNSELFFSPKPGPNKEIYTVRSGDVITRVAQKMKTTPEMIVRVNKLTSDMLRIEQKLIISRGDFSVDLKTKEKKVVLLDGGRFFKQYDMVALPTSLVKKKTGTPPPAKLAGKVTQKLAWGTNGAQVAFNSKEYADAAHWIAFSVPGHTLYSLPREGSDVKPPKPPSGIGLAATDMDELAALLNKGANAIIEP